MDEKNQALCRQLDTADTALGFLLLVALSVLLSYAATARQRQALCLTILGDTEQAEKVGEVFPLRLGATALITGSLGYFFMLALDRCRNADPDDPAAKRSARMNVIAGFLVLLATLIRLFDLNFVRRAQPALAGELLPD